MFIRSLSGGLCPEGLYLEGSLSGGSLLRKVLVQGISVWGSLSSGSLFVSFHGGRGLCPGFSVSLPTETPWDQKSERYASYWNAFLWLIIFSSLPFTGDDYIFKQAYVGCYEDLSPTDVNIRDLETLLIYNWYGVTVETCLSACQTLGYSKAALQVCACLTHNFLICMTAS